MGVKRSPAPKKKPKRPALAPAPKSPARPSDLGTKISASVSVVAAMVLATAVNMYASRHYKRWDLTQGGAFTLSAGTVETLRSLDRPVRIISLTSNDDPLGITLAELLESYKAETDRIQVEAIDPDRDRAKLLEVQKRYGLLAGDAGGRTVTDAALVVVMGDQHRYVRQEDLVSVQDAEDMRVRPRLEQAVTGAIRGVRSLEKTKICFTTGHGEPSLEEGGEQGFAELRERLVKNNYEVATVFAPTLEAPKDPLGTCKLLVLGTPTQTVPKDHVAQMKAFVEQGGSALLVVGPIPNDSRNGWVDLGVGELTALAGVELRRDFVFERDPGARPVRGSGEAFFPKAQVHPITDSLMKEEARGAAALFVFASSLRDTGTDVRPEPLLVTSEQSFGVLDYYQRGESDQELTPKNDDSRGPLVVAVAAQRQGTSGKPGARVVVMSAVNPLVGSNWRQPDFRGTALFVEDSITWLAAHEAFLDIPEKPLVTVGLRMSEDAIQSLLYYVVLGIPSVIAAAGVLMFVQRRRRPGSKPKGETA